MNPIGRRIVLLTAFLSILLATASPKARQPAIQLPFDGDLVSPTPIAQPGEYDLRFTYSPHSTAWGEVRFTAEARGKLQIMTDVAWAAVLDSGQMFEHTMRIRIVPNDTSFLRIIAHLDGGNVTCVGRFFVSGDSTAEMTSRMKPPVPQQQIVDRTINVDTLSHEQLQEVLRFEFTLDDDIERSYATKLLGQIHDSLKSSGASRTFIMRMTIEQAYKLHQQGIRIDLAPDIPAKSDQQGKEALDPPLPR